MKKVLLTIIIIVWNLATSTAQSTCNWTVTTPGFGYQSTEDLMYNWGTYDKSSGVDASGNLYVAGSKSVSKYNSAGVLIWSNNYITDPANLDDIHGICVDASGNCYVTGSFNGISVQFGTVLLTNNDDGTDMFVAKIDPSGNVIWANNSNDIIGCGTGTTGTGGKGIVGNSVSVDATGNVYVAGNFISQHITFGSTVLTNDSAITSNCATAVTSDAFITKFDPSGNVIWSSSLKGKYYDLAESIITNDIGESIVLYRSNSKTVAIGSTSLVNSSYSSGQPEFFVIAKYTAGGFLVWAKKLEYAATCRALTINSNNDVIIAGEYTGQYSSYLKLNGTNILQSGTSKGFILKLNSSGAFVWVKSNGGDTRRLTTDASNNIYLTGSLIASPSVFGMNNLFPQNGNVVFTAKYDNNGSVKWAKNPNLGGVSYGVDVDLSKNVFISGSTFLAQVDTSASLVTITAGSATTFCQGDSVVLTAPAMTSYLWSNGATTRSVVVKQSAVYYLTNTCGNFLSNQINVVAKPVPVGSASDQTIGSGEKTNIILNTTIPGYTTCSFTAGLTSGSVSGFSNGTAGTSIGQTLTGNGVVTYTVVPSSNGCAGTSYTVSAVVSSSKPVGSATSQTICSGSQSNVQLNSTLPGTTFTWTAAKYGSNNTTGFSDCTGGCGTIIAQTLTSSGIIKYTVTPVGPSPDFITGNTFTVNVVVSEAGATQVRTQDCGKTLTTLDQTIYCNAVSNAVDYEWEFTSAAVVKTKLRGSGSNSFSPLWIAGIEYGQTYDVRVRSKVGTCWGDFSVVCQISTPATIPSTQIRTADCGITLNALNQLIYCNSVIGATDYQWEYTNAGVTKTKNRGNSSTSFDPTWISGVEYGKTYDIRVKAKVGTQWGSFATVCQVTTPATIPFTQIRTADCGITLTVLNQLIYCKAVVGACDYQWEYTNAGVTKTKNRGNSSTSFDPTWISGVEYGKTYDIRVRAKVGTQWGSFDAVCQVTTPATIPSTQVRTADCGITLTTLSQYIYCNTVIGAVDYEWEYTNAGVTTTKMKGSGLTSFSSSSITGIGYGKTYDVRVRAKVGTQWGSFATVCQVTTPAAAIVQNENNTVRNAIEIPESEASLNYNVAVYPNPANELVSVDFEMLNEEATIELVNLYGQVVYATKTTAIKNNIDTRELQGGIYLLKINSGSRKTINKIIIEK